MFNSFAAEATAMGFARLTISGLRYSGANAGKTVTIGRNLVKQQFSAPDTETEP